MINRVCIFLSKNLSQFSPVGRDETAAVFSSEGKEFRIGLLGVILCIFPLHASAFLGEDLGLDIYKKIDEGMISLEQKQYEYELTGQGETNIGEVLAPIFEENEIECDISGSQDLERILGNGEGNYIEYILQKCGYDGDNPAPVVLTERVQNTIAYAKNTYSLRAEEKTAATYKLSRIGLYTDGDIENSPFDLITDLENIDRIIFTEELEYEGTPYEKNNDERIDEFLEEDKEYLYDEDENEEEELPEEDSNEEEELPEDIFEDFDIIDDPYYHSYVCLPEDSRSGLDDNLEGELISEISGDSGYTPNPTIWEYPGGIASNGASWGGPFPGGTPTGFYNSVTDEWGCDPSSFFCIIIEFEKSSYGLTGGESMSIEKIIARAGKHLEKPANTSLTQRKMTTNNFELGSIIKNLPDMLRGFGMEVQSKPIPILDLENENSDVPEGDIYEIENMIAAYYKNSGLDYERANDLSIFGKISGQTNSEEAQKIFQTSAGMSIRYPESRINELAKFQRALRRNNDILSLSVEKEIVQSEMKEFTDQFAELERFVESIEDFVKGVTGTIDVLKKIPQQGA